MPLPHRNSPAHHFNKYIYIMYYYMVFRLIGVVFSSKNVCKLTFYGAGLFWWDKKCLFLEGKS